MNNLQDIWNDLDEAYEYMERAIEKNVRDAIA